MAKFFESGGNMPITRMIVQLSSAGLIVLGASVVAGQDFPNRTIRILAGSVGGGGDFLARIVSQGISGPLGQPVVVENISSTLLAAGIVTKAPPDGHYLLVTGNSFWVGPLLQKVPYDVERDFSPVSLLVREVSIV